MSLGLFPDLLTDKQLRKESGGTPTSDESGLEGLLGQGASFLQDLIGGNKKQAPPDVDQRVADIFKTEVEAAKQNIDPELIKTAQEERIRQIAEQELSLAGIELNEETINSAVEDLKIDLEKLRQGS